jgi:hypothetical protein
MIVVTFCFFGGLPCPYFFTTSFSQIIATPHLQPPCHPLRGLEFPVVCIPGIGYMPNQHSTAEEEARLLYVGMTRAIDQLILSCDRSSEFTSRLESVLGK